MLEVGSCEAEGLERGALGGEAGLLDGAWGWGGRWVIDLLGEVLLFRTLCERACSGLFWEMFCLHWEANRERTSGASQASSVTSTQSSPGMLTSSSQRPSSSSCCLLSRKVVRRLGWAGPMRKVVTDFLRSLVLNSR